MKIIEQIVARELDAVIVYESPDVIAFADHEPINVGHLLIAPTRPYQTFIELPDYINEEIQRVAKDLYERIENLYSPDGITFMQNNGAFNDLGHYHLHIFPRFEEDGFSWVSTNLGVQSIETLKKSLVGI
ncbi:HIT family protein [Enterovibrio sp. ZSDZ42]|uniref:HIT family protein n=1 Tax=Enterovibrio gelatinilyticus TaxID=2899819 RepID=A0ABT5QYD1_9GAMM|nr:HIT family protein [Enterovibrio sp. ZSDZ42]MDD1793023.1 HIT family protein [Enterovibrio sp. ZSDZ42]